jgi:hypothetical protein
MFQTKVVEKIETHILRSIFFFLKFCLSWDVVGKYVELERQHMTNGACAFHAGYLSLETHTHNMWYLLLFHCNNGSLTRVIVALYAHFLSCSVTNWMYFFNAKFIRYESNVCIGQCDKNGNSILLLIMDKHLHSWQTLKIAFAVVIGNERVSLFRWSSKR